MYALADTVGNHKVAEGSVILLGSVSYLGEVGTAQYLLDWCKSRWWLKTRLGNGCHVIPLVPVPGADLRGEGLVRALLETLTWFVTQNATETVLVCGILEKFIGTYIRQGTGGSILNGRQCFRVPAGLDTKTTVSLVSEGWGVRPDGIPAMSKAAEESIVISLIAMLNSAFGTGLSSAICFDRTGSALVDARLELSKKQLVVVAGASNAGRLATALVDNGTQVLALTSPGWKVSKQNVERLVQELVNLSPAPDTIVLQCMDNSAYFVLNEDGTLTMPTKSRADNKYHVVGELKLANREQTHNLIKMLRPVLSCITGTKVLLLTCLPRFLHMPCCEDPCHMVDGEKMNLAEDLRSMKKAIRSAVFAEKLKDVRVVDPTLLCSTDDPSCWEDPVHLAREQYVKMAEAIIGMIAGVDQVTTDGDRGSDIPDAKRVRLLSSMAPPGAGGPTAGGRGRGAGVPAEAAEVEEAAVISVGGGGGRVNK